MTFALILNSQVKYPFFCKMILYVDIVHLFKNFLEGRQRFGSRVKRISPYSRACPSASRVGWKTGGAKILVKFHFLLGARWCRWSFRVKTRPLACPILPASPEPRLSRGANERKARQSAGRINPGRVRRRETGAALMPGLSRRAPQLAVENMRRCRH